MPWIGSNMLKTCAEWPKLQVQKTDLRPECEQYLREYEQNPLHHRERQSNGLRRRDGAR